MHLLSWHSTERSGLTIKIKRIALHAKSYMQLYSFFGVENIIFRLLNNPVPPGLQLGVFIVDCMQEDALKLGLIEWTLIIGGNMKR